MKLIPTPEQFGAALQQPNILQRCAIIMKVISDPKRIREEQRIMREFNKRPTPYLKDFPEIAKF